MQSNPTTTDTNSASQKNSSTEKSTGSGEVPLRLRAVLQTLLGSFANVDTMSVLQLLGDGTSLQMTLTEEVLEWMLFLMSSSYSWKLEEKHRQLTNTSTRQWLLTFSSRTNPPVCFQVESPTS